MYPDFASTFVSKPVPYLPLPNTLLWVEGILVRAANELEALQEERKKVDPQTAEAIDHFLLKLKACAKGEASFTFILDDPAGNSFIESPFAPSPDPSLTIKFYERSPEQQALLGYLVNTSQVGELGDEASSEEINATAGESRREPHGSIGEQQLVIGLLLRVVVQTLLKLCFGDDFSIKPVELVQPSVRLECSSPVSFITLIIGMRDGSDFIQLAGYSILPRSDCHGFLSCDACGYRSSEVKPGGRIPEKGKKITVLVKNIDDLSRDVIKSDTASVKVPELDLELASGTLGGLVTTVEGLITKISENLERVHGFTFGDSLDDRKKSRWQDFRTRLKKLLSVEETWTLIIDDALANSFVAPATDDIKDDHQLTFEEYERSWEQNEELGLNDMDTSSADAAYKSTDANLKEGTDG
ncbi:ZPR1 zinc-finger domain protein [Actinidia rufa]|uniref:ZPR1 zinc-finger domain protein n=1 Tax=Actinidia rufa TaxID=165716 RepID=A0A7J0DXV6_9ERIC|nr:ZPR1 zinc-finger domain protein [Actinidia rufa]